MGGKKKNLYQLNIRFMWYAEGEIGEDEDGEIWRVLYIYHKVSIVVILFFHCSLVIYFLKL